MTHISRRDLEILLDGPDRRDPVLSAYVDLRVRDGFRRFVDVELANLVRSAEQATMAAAARKVLADGLDPIHRAVAAAEPAARGLAVFSGPGRGLFHVVSLGFPVANRLVLDEEPFVLPLLERWYGIPSYLVALVSSRRLHLFDAFAGVTEPAGGVSRPIDREVQREKHGFTYKKRYSHTFFERLQDLDHDDFLKQAAGLIAEHWHGAPFNGLILLGQPPITSAVRRLLPKEVARAIVDEHAQEMTERPDDVAGDVARAVDRWHDEHRRRLVHELHGRWARSHLVANGASEVLDALQQGRATDVVLGDRRDLTGSRCVECGYRFGRVVDRCSYCQGPTRAINAAQEIMRLALRQRVAEVHLLRSNGDPDPLMRVGGVAALLRAGANWSSPAVPTA